MATGTQRTLELPERYRAMVLEILRAQPDPVEVWAYGSRVSGGGHDASDLDLVVRNLPDAEAPVAGLSRLKSAFSESHLPIRVDVHDWARLPASFRDEILHSHVVVWPQA
jgi:predicted nucleotidyltransferase